MYMYMYLQRFRVGHFMLIGAGAEAIWQYSQRGRYGAEGYGDSQAAGVIEVYRTTSHAL